MIKGPKVYIRDSGLLHSLLDIAAMDQLLGHPVAGNSWEGFVIENIINVNSANQFQPYFYRTRATICRSGNGLWFIPGKDAYLLSGNTQVISLQGLALKLAEQDGGGLAVQP